MKTNSSLVVVIIFFLTAGTICTAADINKEKSLDEMFAFPGWNRKQPITIQASQVAGSTNLVDFPVLITLDHLNNEILDGGANSALNGGGDIRFSSDSAGNNQLAIEVVEFVTSGVPANRRCQIWVKIPVLSATANTTIYIWYNKAGEVQPPSNSSYGSQSVWTNYDFVTHDMRTESSSGQPITLNSAAGLAPGPFGTDVSHFNGIDNFHTWDPSGMGLNTKRTISFWLNFDTTIINWQRIFQLATLDTHAGAQFVVTNGRIIFGTVAQGDDFIQATSTKMLQGYTAGNWHRISGSWNPLETGSDLKVNTVTATSTGTDRMNPGSGLQTARFGNRSDGQAIHFYDGRLAYFTISKDLLSDEYMTTEYNNQSNPSAFALSGTPVSTSAGNDTQAPTASTLTSTGQTDTTVNLSWSGATDNVGVTGYRLYKDNILETTLGNVSTYQVTGLTASTGYAFKVRSLDAAGNESPDSNVLSITSDASSGSGGTGGGNTVWTESNSVASYTGDVAVGRSTVPTGYKMAVEGKIRSREVRVDQENWPDYVFEKDYDLPTLDEIQKYIDKNGHLPNIPSAKEVESNGIELGEMNKLLLEKIEELILYTLIQENKIQSQEKIINEQEDRLFAIEAVLSIKKK